MKMTFIGSGGMGTLDNFHSNILLENKLGKKLLLDCGADAKRSLHEIGLSYLDITDVYISHLHSDHIGSLEWLAFCTKFDPRCDKPKLIISRFLRGEMWSKSLSGGLQSLQNEINDLNTYFKVESVAKNGTFVWSGIDFQLVQTVHIMDGFSLVHSFGLMFYINGTKIFWTSDTQFCPEQIKDFYNSADIIFQDCETSPFRSGVHAHYDDLKTLPEEVRAKMWLYHYQDGPLPGEIDDGFLGFVAKGQVFNF